MLASIMVIWTLVMLIYNRADLIISLLLPLLTLTILGLLDDIYNIKQLPRMVVHLSVTVFVLLNGFTIESIDFFGLNLILPVWIIALVSATFIIWMINLYNFMDGIDGLAGGMTIIGFAVLAVAGYIHHQMLYSILSLVICVSACGFLYWNFPPARIFMGDRGSIPLGFLSAIFIIWGNKLGVLPVIGGLILFSPFIIDATLTLFKRAFKGEKIWEAHKTHYYQRMVTHGWTHKRVILAEYCLMLINGAATILFIVSPPFYQACILAVIAAMYLSLVSYIELNIAQ